MRWRGQRESSNVEDRRGVGGKTIALGGGGLGLIVMVVAVLLCGGDFSDVLRVAQQQQRQAPQEQRPQQGPQGGEDRNSKFSKVVLASTEDTWNRLFRESGQTYRQPKLVLFTGRTNTACGLGDAAMGPFYCPGDEKLYLDFQFFRELEREFKAPGDFAQAYVIAHEVGHHIQNLTGVMSKVTRAQRSMGKAQANQLSVKLELQADCFAGIWAADANRKGLVEAGDAEEAIRAAAAVGDDMIQKRSRGYVVPESFTHGTARQRMEWFTRGFKSGDLRQCKTFE